MEGQIILKDKFIAQLVPDIWRKLQKLAFGYDQGLEHLLRVCYNRGQEEWKENKKRDWEKTEALVMALQGVNLGVSKVRGLGQRPMPGVCFLWGKEGPFKWECPKTQRSLEEGLPLKTKVSVVDPSSPGSRLMAPVLITTQPWVTLNVGIQSHFSVLLSNPGPLLRESATFIFLASRLQNSLHNLWVVTGNPFSFLNTFLIVSESNFSFRNS